MFRLRARLTRPLLALAVAVGGLGVADTVNRSASAEGSCRITGGSATLLVREPAPGAEFTYEGAMFVTTRDCGDGPLSIKGVFTPIAGTPASCAAMPSTFETLYTNQSQASCNFTGSAGIGLPGTPVTVSATAEVAGLVEGGDWIGRRDPGDADEMRLDPETARVTTVCVLMLPEVFGRQTCTLF